VVFCACRELLGRRKKIDLQVLGFKKTRNNAMKLRLFMLSTCYKDAKKNLNGVYLLLITFAILNLLYI